MAAPNLFQTEQNGSTLIVIFNEQAGTCPELELLNQLNTLVEQFEPAATTLRAVPAAAVFDLGDVPYFSSILLNALLSFWKQVRNDERLMVLCSPSEVGREILELSRFHTLWPIFDSRDEAIQSVGD